MRKSLTKAERIKSKADFSRVFNSPDRRAKCYGARLLARENSLGMNRFAVTLVRKYGNAVQRNYAKRILREIYRLNKPSIPEGYDIVVVLFPGEFLYHERKKQFLMLIRRAGFVTKIT